MPGPHGPRRSGRWLRALLLAAPLALPWGSRDEDIGLYFSWARQLARGAWPYRDFALEYPPLALLAALPGLVGAQLPAFAAAFIVGQAALDALVRAWAMPRRARRSAWVLAHTALLAPLYMVHLKRLDTMAAACVTCALAGLTWRPQARWPWLLVGAGAAIKLYPLVLLPAMAAYAWRRGQGLLPVLGRAALAPAVLLGLSGVASLWAGADAWQWLAHQRGRGLHAPTSYVAWAIVTRGLGTAMPHATRFGALEVVAPWADAAAARADVLVPVAWAGTLTLVLPRIRTATALWRAALALVLALLLTSKVFSPQYVVWLVPLGVASCAARRRVDGPLLALLAVVCACTGMLYPGEPRLLDGARGRQLALLARTGAMLLAWGWAVVRLEGGRYSPRLGVARGARAGLGRGGARVDTSAAEQAHTRARTDTNGDSP